MHFYYIFQTDGNGDPDEVQLDAEMEKVFAGTNRDNEKFDVTQFRDGDSNETKGDRQGIPPPKYHELDYDGKCYNLFYFLYVFFCCK